MRSELLLKISEGYSERSEESTCHDGASQILRFAQNGNSRIFTQR